MSVRINLLPKTYQPPKQLGAKEWGMAAAAAVVLVATGAYYASVYAAVGETEHQTEAARTQLQDVKVKLADAQEVKGREERVAKAEADLKALAGRHWSGVLLTLRGLTPTHVTWTSLSVQGDSIVLKGTSRGIVDVAQLLGGLITDTAVAQVSLKYINEVGVPITVTVKPGDKAATPQKLEPPQQQDQTVDGPKEMEFEMTITLVPAEGGQPNGA